MAVGLFALFTYLKNAHSNRNQETGQWAWNPVSWFGEGSNTTIIAGVNTNTDFSDVTGYVGVGSGFHIPAVSYNSNNGVGVGYWSPQGASFTYPGQNPPTANEVVSKEIAEVRQGYGAAWRASSNGIFGSNYELGPIGIGLNFEIAYPEWLPWTDYNTGFSISFGLVADSKNNLDFYVTERTPTKNNVTFSAAPEVFYVESMVRQVYNQDLEGFSNQFGIGIGIIGGSVSSDRQINYRQWTITGFGYGIDVSTGSWESYTKLYKIYRP